MLFCSFAKSDSNSHCHLFISSTWRVPQGTSLLNYTHWRLPSLNTPSPFTLLVTCCSSMYGGKWRLFCFCSDWLTQFGLLHSVWSSMEQFSQIALFICDMIALHSNIWFCKNYSCFSFSQEIKWIYHFDYSRVGLCSGFYPSRIWIVMEGN